MASIETEKRFISFIQQHERIIYKVCSFYVSDEHPLADLYQEVVYNLWKGFLQFRNESTASTWIYRVALNTCITGFRREKRKELSDIPLTQLEEVLAEPDTPGSEEHIREMYRLINQLKALEKAIVLLYLDDKSYKEIAEITGLTVSNVATKLKRSREKLREMSNK